MALYLDTSVCVALLKPEPSSDRAEGIIAACSELLLVSDFAAAEFASATARLVRMREIGLDAGRAMLAEFDAWLSATVQRVGTEPVDIAAADAYLRRFDVPLRAPDAIHIAIARRLGAALATFDEAMASTARRLGVAVAEA